MALPAGVAALLICDSGDRVIVCSDCLTPEEAWAAKIIAVARGCVPAIVLWSELDFILKLAA